VLVSPYLRAKLKPFIPGVPNKATDASSKNERNGIVLPLERGKRAVGWTGIVSSTEDEDRWKEIA
jgi:hypothetical protein